MKDKIYKFLQESGGYLLQFSEDKHFSKQARA